MKYWIERWAQLRKKELISYPHDFPIHEVYQALCSHEELISGFEELYQIFIHCYEDILNNPAKMILPVYDMNEYGYFSKEARTSRIESYKYAKIFYVLGCSGELTQNVRLYIQADKLKDKCKALKITNIHTFLNILGNYGIVTEGLVNGRIKNHTHITISFPGNKHLITALYIMAVKSDHTDRFKDFCSMNYKLFESDWNTVEYGNGVDMLSVFFHSKQEQTTAHLIHDELLKRNYYYNFQDWNEGPQIRYYQKESDRNRNTNASFWLACMDTELKLYFRIANMDKVLAYIKNCPESVISAFSVSDKGCRNRISGNCVSGISYQLNNSTIWRCGCCNPNFQVTPGIEDYLYYINAAELSASQKPRRKL